MTFRNNVAAFLWGFSAIFLVLVAAMTYVFVRDGAPFGYSPIIVTGALAPFWVGAVGFTAYSTSKHCLRVSVQSDSHVLMTWRFPFRKEERIVACTDIASATVVESNDDEDATYFYARVLIQDGMMKISQRVTIGRHVKRRAYASMRYWSSARLRQRRERIVRRS